MAHLPAWYSAFQASRAQPRATAYSLPLLRHLCSRSTTQQAKIRQTNPGERLRDALQPLVVDGTLSADQADSVATHLVENRPERSDRGNRGRRGPGKSGRSEVLTELLGIGADELRDELRTGATLAELAAAKGVETSALVAALMTEAEERLNAAVEAEQMTADEAAEKLTEIETGITDKINGN